MNERTRSRYSDTQSRTNTALGSGSYQSYRYLRSASSKTTNAYNRMKDTDNSYHHYEDEEENIEPPVLSSYAMSLLESANEESGNKENVGFISKHNTESNSTLTNHNLNNKTSGFTGTYDTIERTSFSNTLSGRLGTTRAPLRLVRRFGLDFGTPQRASESSDEEENANIDKVQSEVQQNHGGTTYDTKIGLGNYETDDNRSKYSNTNYFGNSLKTAATTYDFDNDNYKSCSPRIKRNNLGEKYENDTRRKLLFSRATTQTLETPKKRPSSAGMNDNNVEIPENLYATPEQARKTLTPLSQKKDQRVLSPIDLNIQKTPNSNPQELLPKPVLDSPYFKALLEAKLREQRLSILEEVRKEKVESVKVKLNDEQSSPSKQIIKVKKQSLECIELIGKGGSSKVYRVKLIGGKNIPYALKVVTCDQYDDSTIKGFMGEIDILLKFRDEKRVVKLLEYSIENGTIKLLMECGEIDLASVLGNRTKEKSLDLAFIRFHSMEMLKCVHTVHKYDVIHSDLKPANFLFVKGMLKIIDFGISNSIGDQTVNVYRESQIGTPNYMAPETLIETNHTLKLNGSDTSDGSTWKVGKPADIWSCGCIIYQMVYGRPPYGSFKANQRLAAIMDPKVEINYPTETSSGEVVPSSLIHLMKMCLQRDPTARFTVEQAMTCSFLKPTSISYEQLNNVIKNSIRYGSHNPDCNIYSPKIRKLVDNAWKDITEQNENI